MAKKSNAENFLMPERSTFSSRFEVIARISKRDLAFFTVGVIATLLFVFLIESFTTINFSFGKISTKLTTISDTSPQGGQVALTESQLRGEVKKIKVPVYWVGPQSGARYTLENQANTRIFVRYLPDGKIPPQGEATKRIIGTYILQEAFDSTKKAGATIANGIGFINDDGAAVYYNTSSPNNVYVAYSNVDAQIEIFDPVKGVAVQLATVKGALQQIK